MVMRLLVTIIVLLICIAINLVNCYTTSPGILRNGRVKTTLRRQQRDEHQRLRQHPFLLKVQTSNNNAYRQVDRITFQYSPSSLKHLEATELPDNYNRPWTTQKLQAIGGALLLGSLSAAIGYYATTLPFLSPTTNNNADDYEEIFKVVFILLASIGSVAGYYLAGGKRVQEAERPINGGYDRKLVMDKPARLRSVLEDLEEYDGATVIRTQRNDLPSLALEYIRAVHGGEYLDLVRTRSATTDRPVRFDPLYARTLVDNSTFTAAVHAVADWMDAVDAVVRSEGSSTPTFALARPPGHHACRSKAMGGCYFNNAAIAAFYALDQPGINTVGILDIDAHHGNGVAHCVQNEKRIRYCSIHETKNDGYLIDREKERKDDDPRGPTGDDCGPLGNIRNVNLVSGTGWESGYEAALVTEALPFFMEGGKPDLVIIAAGFDAVASDGTSRLMLDPDDFGKIGEKLFETFGNQCAFGLEGGYSWEERDLSRSLVAFVEPWRKGP